MYIGVSTHLTWVEPIIKEKYIKYCFMVNLLNDISDYAFFLVILRCQDETFLFSFFLSSSFQYYIPVKFKMLRYEKFIENHTKSFLIIANSNGMRIKIFVAKFDRVLSWPIISFCVEIFCLHFSEFKIDS